MTRAAETRRFILFLLVGGVNTLAGYTFFALFILFGLGATSAAVGSTILGILFNFRSTGLIVFGSRSAALLPRFVIVYGLQCAANIALLRLAARAGIPALAAEIVILPLLAIASFLLLRQFVFASTSGARS